MGSDGLTGGIDMSFLFKEPNIAEHTTLLKKELETIRKERDVYSQFLYAIIENLKGDFELYNVGKHIENELDNRLDRLKSKEALWWEIQTEI